jgi:hypothetical protein
MSKISNKFLAQVPADTLKGNNTGSTANVTDLTVAQVNAILPVFTSSLKGLAPSSGGGTTNYLRADGTWATVAASGPITGITDGSNAASGIVGEYVSANPGSSVAPVTSGVDITITSISLTAGDWDVYGTACFSPGTGTVSFFSVGISLNPTSYDSFTLGGLVQADQPTFPNAFYLLGISPRRINITTTTTIYLIGSATYSVLGTANFSVNNIIQARRIR